MGRVSLDLPAEVRDVRVARARVADVGALPEVLHDLVAGEDLAGPLGEEAEQLELRGREADGLPVDRDRVAREVDPDAADVERRAGAALAIELAAPQEGAHPADELRGRERLGHRVGGARLGPG